MLHNCPANSNKHNKGTKEQKKSTAEQSSPGLLVLETRLWNLMRNSLWSLWSASTSSCEILADFGQAASLNRVLSFLFWFRLGFFSFSSVLSLLLTSSEQRGQITERKQNSTGQKKRKQRKKKAYAACSFSRPWRSFPSSPLPSPADHPPSSSCLTPPPPPEIVARKERKRQPTNRRKQKTAAVQRRRCRFLRQACRGDLRWKTRELGGCSGPDLGFFVLYIGGIFMCGLVAKKAFRSEGEASYPSPPLSTRTMDERKKHQGRRRKT